MNRILLATATTAFLTGCPDSDSRLVLDLTVERVGVGNGTIEVTDSGTVDTDCADECKVAITPGDDNTVTVTAVPDSESVFLGWEGSADGCEGTAPVLSFIARKAGNWPCSARFGEASSAGPPREGIVVESDRDCAPDASPAGFTCSDDSYGFYRVLAPTDDLLVVLPGLSTHCYGYADLTEFPSKDLGVVTLTTSQATVTATHGGTDYAYAGRPPGGPFVDPDSLEVTTTDGTVMIDAPSNDLELVEGAAGLAVRTFVPAAFWRWEAYRSTSAGDSAVICEFESSATEFELAAAEAIAILDEALGGRPDIVVVGTANQASVEGFGTARAVQALIIDGTLLSY